MAHLERYMEVCVHRSGGRTANPGEACFRHKALVQPDEEAIARSWHKKSSQSAGGRAVSGFIAFHFVRSESPHIDGTRLA